MINYLLLMSGQVEVHNCKATSSRSPCRLMLKLDEKSNLMRTALALCPIGAFNSTYPQLKIFTLCVAKDNSFKRKLASFPEVPTLI